ncbi:uncharacterized protein MONOS_5325 [Monocercomonoides exilis]|uniref:uncharacterized protein n=1 Tax=Monocercomonoides exilis TaxID=2049356 RepID=UPI003559DE1F|nr:hypothetical protein MONOS_5325 [Monocercomonoides exilis]|eukprot:MONOS_5325.1-p1 / transcript=MONOS_5325.1 / gene=MONOS_5325 / organism=Monocercomonoides_exilis_PA203 / gene_product=unspecified product / transcript_product=unspecified product / location=Mono_scaffold00153:86137-87568(-) / protein_length=315 / sequence_SO=supercontig / SO=protein_coding / is_pseudo=false
MSVFDTFKQKAANLGQKMLVKMGQAEEFKETEEFTKSIDNFKMTRICVDDLAKKGKKMLEISAAASEARLAFYNSLLEFAGKSPTLDPRVVKYAEALKAYEEYQREFTQSLARVAVVPETDFYEKEITQTREKKNALSSLRTSRDAAAREKNKEQQPFKAEKAAAEYQRLDDKYKADRAALLEAVDGVERKKNHDVLKQVSLVFEEMYNMHATSYSDMATLEPEVKTTLNQLTSAEAKWPAAPAGHPSPAAPGAVPCSSATPSANPVPGVGAYRAMPAASNSPVYSPARQPASAPPHPPPAPAASPSAYARSAKC